MMGLGNGEFVVTRAGGLGRLVGVDGGVRLFSNTTFTFALRRNSEGDRLIYYVVNIKNL